MAKERIIISQFGRTKLNNSEYTNFIIEVKKLADAAGYEKLGIDAAELAEFGNLVEQLVQVGQQTAAKKQTLTLSELDHQRDRLSLFIIAVARYGRSIPIDDFSTAAGDLYLKLKPYVGMEKIALTQQSAQVNSLISMLEEADNKANATAIGLTDHITKLKQVQADFEAQYNSRAESQVDDPVINLKTIRAEIDALYDIMIMMAQAKILTSPSDAGRTFVKGLNKLIDDTDRLHHTRITAEATRQKNKEESN